MERTGGGERISTGEKERALRPGHGEALFVTAPINGTSKHGHTAPVSPWQRASDRYGEASLRDPFLQPTCGAAFALSRSFIALTHPAAVVGWAADYGTSGRDPKRGRTRRVPVKVSSLLVY